MPWLAWTIVAVVAALILVHIAVVRTVLGMIERTPPLSAGDAACDSQAEVIRFPATDGLMLNGCLFRPKSRSPRGIIVFCPELGATCWSATSYCQALLDAGFALFAFDFRNHGDSDSHAGYEPFHWLTTFEIEDVRGAIEYVNSNDELRSLPLALFGVSRGGSAALTVAPEFDSIRCIACEGAYSSHQVMRLFSRRYVSLFGPNWIMRHCPAWHTDTMLFLARIVSQIKRRCRYVRLEPLLPLLKNLPVLLIAGERDNYVLPEGARTLEQGIGSDQTTLWVVPGARHNQAREAAAETYDRKLVEFFEQLVPAKEADPSEESPMPACQPSESDTVEPSLVSER